MFHVISVSKSVPSPEMLADGMELKSLMDGEGELARKGEAWCELVWDKVGNIKGVALVSDDMMPVKGIECGLPKG